MARTEIDSWLADVCDGGELTPSVATDFLIIFDITEAIARHGAPRPPKAEAETILHHSQENVDLDVMDDFLVLMNYGGANSIETEQLAADDVVELFFSGYEVLPADLMATMASLQPTSVPSERSLSHACHLRRSCQEKQDHDRYSSYLLLKDFYRKNRPNTSSNSSLCPKDATFGSLTNSMKTPTMQTIKATVSFFESLRKRPVRQLLTLFLCLRIVYDFC